MEINIVNLLDKSQGIIATMGGILTILAFFGVRFRERIVEISTFNYKSRKRYFKKITKISYNFIHSFIFVFSFVILGLFWNIPDNFNGVLILIFLITIYCSLLFNHKGEIAENKLLSIKKRKTWNFIDRHFYTFIYFLTEWLTMGLLLVVLKTQFISNSQANYHDYIRIDILLVGLMIFNYLNYRITDSMMFDSKYSYKLILKDKITCFTSDELQENRKYYFIVKKSDISETGFRGDEEFISEFDDREIIQIDKNDVHRVICNIKTLGRISTKK